MVNKVLQIDYDSQRDRLGGGTWRRVSFECNDDGWYMPGKPGVSPVGLWARESTEG